MLKTITLVTLFAATIASSFAANIAGTLNWISGTLVSTVNPSFFAQTIQLQIGSTTQTFPNTYVTGIDPYAAGTPFALLLQGSQPFAATYSVNQLVALPPDTIATSARRPIPMTSSGFITGNIAFPTANSFNLTLYLPGFQIGTLSFRNGMIETFNVPSPNFSFPIPTSSASPTVGSMTFDPGTFIPQFSFLFSATGTGSLTFQGSGTTPTLSVAGTTQGGTIYTTANLTISAAAY